MKPATTVRQELESYIKQAGLTLQQFSEISGVNPGTISAMLSGYRQISIHNLDLITEGMGLEQGSLYEIYLEECLRGVPMHWRRLGAFIRRCAELDKLDCLERLVQAVADRLAYMPLLFETAEQFFSRREKSGGRPAIPKRCRMREVPAFRAIGIESISFVYDSSWGGSRGEFTSCRFVRRLCRTIG